MSLAPVAGAELHDADWHCERLLEFTAAKAAIGEPSPHMTVVNYLSRDMDVNERLWRIGCYANPYSLVSAIALWTSIPWKRAWLGEPHQFAAWVQQWWDGIHTRTERRAVRTPAKFTRCLVSYRDWVASGEPERLLLQRADYEQWWAAVNRVDFFGRYISIRVIEAIRRGPGKDTGDPSTYDPRPEMELPDIRGIGGHSPVRALTLFYPGATDRLLEPDWALAELLAEDLWSLLNRHQPISRYVLAAMLCEYREAFEDNHQYPGRTLDQELEYANGKHAAFWEANGLPVRDQLFAARKDLFPAKALGEVQGTWDGVRDDLSRWVRDRGEVWSDLTHDYAMERQEGVFVR